MSFIEYPAPVGTLLNKIAMLSTGKYLFPCVIFTPFATIVSGQILNCLNFFSMFLNRKYNHVLANFDAGLKSFECVKGRK